MLPSTEPPDRSTAVRLPILGLRVGLQSRAAKPT